MDEVTPISLFVVIHALFWSPQDEVTSRIHTAKAVIDAITAVEFEAHSLRGQTRAEASAHANARK